MTASRLRRSAALSLLAVGSLVATVSTVGTAAAQSSPPVVDYLITPASFDIGNPPPTTFDFGDVPIDTVSAPQVTTVTNTSGGPITPVLTAGNLPAGVFSATQNCTGQTLQAGGSCTISFVFQPGTEGAQSGTTTAALNGQSFTIGYAGNGVKAFLIDPTSLDFGNVQNGGHSATQAVTVTNVTGGAEAISGFVNPAAPFGASSDCAGTLAAGASCHMYFQYNPTALGTQSATSTGSWRTQSFSINLTGRSYKAGLKPTTPYAITSTGLDLGDVPLNNTSGPQSVTFTNITTASVPTGIISVVGSFTETNNCPSSLAAGASCTMNVLFHPAGLGTQNGSASGTWDGQAFAVNLTGNGIETIPDHAHWLRLRPGARRSRESDANRRGQERWPSDDGPDPELVQLPGRVSPSRRTAGHIKLPSGGTCHMRFQYAPTSPGEIFATAAGSWNDQTFNVSMEGAGAP